MDNWQQRVLIEAQRQLGCDTARLTQPLHEYFLVIGWKRNTKTDREQGVDAGQWFKDGVQIEFDYVHETCVASGRNEGELLAAIHRYKSLQGMSWRDYFASLKDEASTTNNVKTHAL